MILPEELINYIALDKYKNPRNKTESIFALCKVLDTRYSPKTENSDNKRIIKARNAIDNTVSSYLLKFKNAMYAGRLKGMEKAYDEKFLSGVNTKIKTNPDASNKTQKPNSITQNDKITFDALLKNVRNKNGNNDFMEARNKKIEKKIKKEENKENTTNSNYSDNLTAKQQTLAEKSRLRKLLKGLENGNFTVKEITEKLIQANKLREALMKANESTDIEETIENIRDKIIENSKRCVKDALALEPKPDNDNLKNKIANLNELEKTMRITSLEKWSESKGTTNALEQITSAVNAYDRIILLSKNSQDCFSKIEGIKTILKTLENVTVVDDNNNAWKKYLNEQYEQAGNQYDNICGIQESPFYYDLSFALNKEELTEKLSEETGLDEQKLAAYMLKCKDNQWKLDWDDVKERVSEVFKQENRRITFLKPLFNGKMGKYGIKYTDIFTEPKNNIQETKITTRQNQFQKTEEKQTTQKTAQNQEDVEKLELYQQLLEVSSEEELTEKLNNEEKLDAEQFAAYMLICKNKNWKLIWSDVNQEPIEDLHIGGFNLQQRSRSFSKVMDKYGIVFPDVFVSISPWQFARTPEQETAAQKTLEEQARTNKTRKKRYLTGKLKALSEGSSSFDENKKTEFKKILKAAIDSGIKFKSNTIIELYSKLWFDPAKFSQDCEVSIDDVCSDYKK